MKNIYFDNAATTKLDAEVLKEMMPYLTDYYGNASSVYSIGRESRKAVEDARERVAKALNCKSSEIYFTSGGSESDNTALRGIANKYKEKGKHIITSKIEHPAILQTCKKLEDDGYEVTYLNVNKDGFISLNELEQSIRPDTILISIMFANNEIGTIQPIKEIGNIAHKHNIVFHTDAVQAIGNVNVDVKNMNIDMLSLSGHKFYGPKGIGVLYVSNNVRFDSLIKGGHQEKNKRAGTENVAGIVGLGKAIKIASDNLNNNSKNIKELRDYYMDEITKRVPNVIINGSLENRLPGNANISFPGISGESLLLNLDMNGICASSGSACTSSSLETSHVLIAIGADNNRSKCALRISIGKHNTKEEIDYLVNNIDSIVKRLRNI